MRKINSSFRTQFLSEEGNHLINRDYFAFVELDNLACYVIADGIDEDLEQRSAKLAVTTILSQFTEAPSMSVQALKRYMNEANKALGVMRDGMQLKASVTVVLTDYVKLRYAFVGNTRFCLIRNDRLAEQSRDQSLTSNMMKEGMVEWDKAAIHEERHNLYSYLGMRGQLNIAVSAKIKLQDGDTFCVYTRGIWEHCDNHELLECSTDAANPQEVIDNAEEVILSKQPETLDNYTLAATFVDKIYRKPNKKWTLKKILLIVIPVLIVVLTIALLLFFHYRKKKEQRNQLDTYMESAEKYLMYNNYMKASEEYDEALKLAKTLKDKDNIDEIDQLKKLIEQILLGDQALKDSDYEIAEEAYTQALEMSYENGNAGKDYIESQLNKNKGYVEVYDLLSKGDNLLESGGDEAAREAYTEAKDKASDIFFQEGKQEAIDKIAALDQKKAEKEKEEKEAEEAAKAEAAEKKAAEEEAAQAAKAEAEERKKAAEEARLKAEEKAEEEAQKAAEAAAAAAAAEENARKAKEADRLSAIEIEKYGNDYYAQGDYENALLYYYTAREMYVDLELKSRIKTLDKKIKQAEKKKNT